MQNLYSLFYVVTEVSVLLSLWSESDLTVISLNAWIQLKKEDILSL